MGKGSVVEFRKPGDTVEDALTEVLREGSRKLLAEAIEVEVEDFINRHSRLRDNLGHRRVVRNGHLPGREIMTGIGAVKVRGVRVRDRGARAGQEPIRFASRILPPYLRRTRSLEELIPWLYLKGISTGDFSEALAALLGQEAPGLSPSTISRLKEIWRGELGTWQRRDLKGRHYVYFWVDGVYFNVRMEETNQCILVIIGATEDGRKELVGLWDGYRESEQSWKEFLLDLKGRGLSRGPLLAVGDGALGFWKALPQAYGQTRWQRCWVHKTANVLNKLPKGVQKRAKGHLSGEQIGGRQVVNVGRRAWLGPFGRVDEADLVV